MILAGKYEVLGRIGKGGMGVVYQVRHVDLDTVLALKVLPAELARDPGLVARFQLEARLTARLRHRNIVQVHDFVRDGDSFYLTMEYVRGRNLREYLRGELERSQRPPVLGQVLRIGIQVARALAFAHRQVPAIIHRDIKPSNIAIEEGTGRAVVMDFGIAKVLDAPGKRLTRTGMFVGTVKYSAPEQLRRKGDVDGAADVYSLGLVLYELYTGKSFFAGLGEEEVVARVLSGREEDLSALTRANPRFGALIARATARDRDRRYPTADALLRDLDALRDELASEAGAGDTAAEGGADECETELAPPPAAGRPGAAAGTTAPLSWFSSTDATRSVRGEHQADSTVFVGKTPLPRRPAASLSKRARATARWLGARWHVMIVVVPALVIAAACVAQGVAWIGRPFPGFLMLENKVVPAVTAYGWTGMEAGLPFHSSVVGVAGEPVERANDVYAAVRQVPVGTELRYTVRERGSVSELAVPTMRFGLLDYAATFGLFSVNGVVIVLAGIVVGMLSPGNRAAQVFLVMSVTMGLYPLTAIDLYRGHRFSGLHLTLQCMTPATFFHLASLFPVERQVRGLGRALLVYVPYLVGAVLTIFVLRGYWADPVDLRPTYAAFGFAGIGLVTLVGGTLLAFFQHRRALVRGRVQVTMISVVAAFALPIVVYVDNTMALGVLPANLIALTPLLFFVGVAYAIQKHKLFDAQLIIRRSVVYASLLAGGVTLYALVVTVLSAIMMDAEVLRSPGFMGGFMTVALGTAFGVRTRLSARIEAWLFPHKHRFHRTIHEISEAIAGMTDLDGVFAQVTSALARSLDVTSAAVLLRDEREGSFRESAVIGNAPSGYRLPADSPVARLLMTTTAELFADDFEEDPDLAGVRDAGLGVFRALQAELVIPLLSGGRGVIGALALGRPEGGHALTSEDLDVLRSLAGAIGVAVERSHDAARLLQMAQHRRVIERHLPVGDTGERAAARARACTEARRVRVSVLALRLRGLRAAADRVAPERAAEVLRDYYALVDGIVQARGGTVQHHDGGRLVALFGLPRAELDGSPPSSDHVAEAGHGVLAIRRLLEERSPRWRELDYDVSYGCGIATGPGIVRLGGSGGERRLTVVGEAIDLAEHLAELAEPGTIVAPTAMAQALGSSIISREAGTRAGPDGSPAIEVSVIHEGAEA